jgi:uncharacterized protein (TIGR00106 family)
MFVICDLAIFPIGTNDASIRKYVNECLALLEVNQVKYQVHASGLTLGGEWESISRLVEECIESIHAKGCPRVELNLRICSRKDKTDYLDRHFLHKQV